MWDSVDVGNHPGNFVPNSVSTRGVYRYQSDVHCERPGPAFEKAGIRTKILLYDHNPDVLSYPLSILGDPAASKYVDGTPFHLYGGKASVLTQVDDAYPKKNLYVTEQSVTARRGEGLLGIAEPVRRVMIGATRNQWGLMSGKCTPGFLRRVVFTAGLLAAALPAFAAKGAKPEFGPNVMIFDPSMPSQAIQKHIDAVYATQEHNEFGPQRNAFMFLPGNYSVDVPVGFYTEVMGLGASPDATRIAGNVHADANHEHNNATTTFWRAAEGLSIQPAGGTMQWAVSQAVSLRRMHVRGDLVLHQKHGWASGGWMADSLVDGNVDSGSQQQWISRNCDWKSWTGSNWNMVFVGVVHPPEGSWPSPPYTTVAHTPVVREKPFLQVNAAGEFSVRVSSLYNDSAGITWRGGETPGETIPIAQFYIARPLRFVSPDRIR